MLRRWHRWLTLAALVLNLGLAASYVAIWARDQQDTPRRYGDFAAFYTAWSMVRGGDGARLYDLEAQARHQRAVVSEERLAGGLLPYLNPPYVALLFAPLAALSIGTALAIWSLGQLGLVIWLLRIVLRQARDRPARERWLLGAAVLAMPPLLLAVELGAFSLLILVAVLKLHEALAASRDRAGGLWLAVGMVKPQLVLLPAVGLLTRRRWRTLGATAAVVLFLAAVCAAVFGPGVWPGFVRVTLAVHRTFEQLGIYPTAMYNLEGALLLAFGPAVRALSPAIALVGLVLGILATAWVWRGPWQPGEPRFDLQMAITLLLGMFTSLHLYPQDGLLLVGAGLLFDSYLRRSGRPREAFAAVALVSPAIWFATALLMDMRWVRFPVVMAVVLGVWMARELRHDPKNDGPRRGGPPEPETT